ncbi:MAG: VCBS repeat-containing protein [Cellulophaga sp.]
MKYLLSFSLLALLFFNCSKEKEPTKAAIYFEGVPSDSSGITFSNNLHYREDMNIIEYLYYYNGGGVAVGDINNDGLEDIYFTANQTPDKLYLNLGNLKFKDISETSGILIDSTWSTGVTMEDVNNDGFLDIYVSKVGNYKGLKANNLLYINNGDQTFTEASLDYGLNFSGFSTQASFFDYDNDGDMDMYLLNHSVHTPRSYGKSNKRFESDSLAGDKLYENKLDEGLSTFEDVTLQAGIYNSQLGYGLALTTSDINQDGLIDIYVGNDFHENDYIYINQGDKTFKESSDNLVTHTSRFTMGVDVADINNDGLLDIFTLDMMPFNHEIFLKSGGEDSDKVSLIKQNFGFNTQYARNNFQLNQGNETFSEVALLTETHATDWSWSVLLEDYDNDGLTDIFITNGIYKRPNDLDYVNYLSTINFSKYTKDQQNKIERKLIDEMPAVQIPNVIFRNKGNLEFERLTEQSGLTASYANGSVYSDLDNDGDLDLVINNINEKASILENKSPGSNDNNFISFSLQGDNELKNPTGAKVYLYADNHTYIKELTTTRGFQSSSSRKLHFGLGKIEKVDSLHIYWLDGKTQIEKELTINQHQIIKREFSSDIKKDKAKFTIGTVKSFPFTHLENTYLDYERESLIPEKLSVEGPAMVTADFNSDGLLDIYIGGAKYQSAELFLMEQNGSYTKQKNMAFNSDSIHEDVDATVFDLDSDGDLDIYVVSGGNDKPEGDPHLEDRIYLNDGQGNFERFNFILPKTNGGSISTGDFNNDGHDDLFLGSRSIPGAYGVSPFSFILKNTGSNGFELIEKINLGMVTDSQWVDINNDKLLDIIVVGDWMPVTILINNGNETFTNKTKQYGLEDTQGMWNTVAISDLDKNGHKDIIVGNTGLNFKWKASKEKPVKLYLEDFDENGQLDPIIFYDFFGHNVPFASKDKLIGQLPTLKKKFLSYTTFSTIKDIEMLTGKSESTITEVKKIAELRSMIYLNFGTDFQGIPLPKEAQMSSIEDFYVGENNKKPFLIFVGNYLDYVTELGSNNANAGGILSSFDKEGFHMYKQLALSQNLNVRRITKISNENYLVVTNNDKSHTITIP